MRKSDRRWQAVAGLCLGLAVSGFPAAAADTAPALGSDHGQAAVAARVRALIDSRQVTELRSERNGNYGVSLLFQPAQLSYYVASFQGGEFWRVIQTDSEQQAETIYRKFAQQTEALAEPGLDALRLRAGRDYADRLIALNKERLNALQQDTQRAQQQSEQVAQQQQQSRQQAQVLSEQLERSSSELDAVQQNLRKLRTEQSDPSLTPVPAASATSASNTTPSD